MSDILGDVHYFLDDMGDEVGEKHGLSVEEHWLNEYLMAYFGYDQEGFLIYLGSGFVKLTFAIFSWNESDALAAVEEWCRANGREDEINEGLNVSEEEYGDYEFYVKELPAPQAVIEA